MGAVQTPKRLHEKGRNHRSKKVKRVRFYEKLASTQFYEKNENKNYSNKVKYMARIEERNHKNKKCLGDVEKIKRFTGTIEAAQTHAKVLAREVQKINKDLKDSATAMYDDSNGFTKKISSKSVVEKRKPNKIKL